MNGLEFLWTGQAADRGFGFVWPEGDAADLRAWAFEQRLCGIKAIALDDGPVNRVDLANDILQDLDFEVLRFSYETDDQGRESVRLRSLDGEESGILGVLSLASLKHPPHPSWSGWFVARKSAPAENLSPQRLLLWVFYHRLNLPANSSWRVHPHKMISVKEAVILQSVQELSVTPKTSVPSLSVIIPLRLSRTRHEDVLAVLEGILRAIGQSETEILLIANEEDSAGWSPSLVIQLLEKLPDGFSEKFRVFYLAAKPGIFCAGIARNFGASKARGRVLAFVDGDTLPSAEWFTDISRRHDQPGSLSVGRRWNHQSVSSSMEPYWEDFNQSAESRLAALNGWKYVCSHTLALHQDDWRRFGGFAWPFQSYGYEDTELGYRLERAGLRRELAGGESAHFDSRTEKESPTMRRKALANSGEVFFGSYPSLEIAHHVYYLFRPSWGARLFEIAQAVRWKIRDLLPSKRADRIHIR